MQMTPPGMAGRADAIARLVLAFRPPGEETRTELASWRPDGLDALRTEYTRLFVNGRSGPAAPPEALAWLSGRTTAGKSEFLANLAEAYRGGGLAVGPAAGRPPDHISVMLEYLHFLEATGAPAETVIAFRERFLAPWVAEFLARLEAAEPLPFYRRAGHELGQVLDLHRGG